MLFRSFSGGFTRTGSANIDAALNITNNQTFSGGTVTFNGNSKVNRLYVGSATRGTTVTLTFSGGATITGSYVDFEDIAISGLTADTTGWTGLASDIGGNSGFTFVNSATMYWWKDTGNISDETKWFLGSGGTGGAARSPLLHDICRFDANSFSATGKTVTFDNNRLPALDFTGATNSPSTTAGTPRQMYGSITLISAMTWFASLSLSMRGAATITSAGKTICTATCTVHMVNGSISLQDAITFGSDVRWNSGTLTTNGYSVTATGFTTNFATAATTFNLGASIVTLSGTGTIWNPTAANFTLNAGTSTIHFTDTSSTGKTFAGGGLTYYNLKWTTGGAGAITITGSNTFSSWIATGGTTKTITITAGTTQTFTGTLANGISGNLITYQSSSVSNYTISDRKSTRLNSSHVSESRMPSSA